MSSDESDDEIAVKTRPRDRKNSDEVNVINVCRQLMRLESAIGPILTPRVIDLFENAMTMERAEEDSSEELLRDLKNVNFLDTVKEKLKGLLIAKFVNSSRIYAIKNSIRNIAALIHKASILKPITTPHAVDLAKLEIAKVLSQTLLEQGKSNVTAEEISDIVEEFMRSQLDEEEKPTRKTSNDRDLTNNDLKILLRNFSDLSEDEQKNLIRYMEKMEKTDSRRVNMLAKYVDAGDEDVDDSQRPSTSRQRPPTVDNRNFIPRWGWDDNSTDYYNQPQPSYEAYDGRGQPVVALSVMAMPAQYL